MERRQLFVPDGLDGTRADAALAKMLGFSRSFAVSVLESGMVRVNDAVVGKADRLRKNTWIDISWEPKMEPQIVPQQIADLTVVHDDDHIVVVNKPVGVAAHPAAGWDGPTVLGALAGAGFRISTSGAPERAGIVHRLDVGTSGLMVVAKSEEAYINLKRAFHDRAVDKVYHAMIQGRIDPLAGTIDAPIGRHPRADWKFAVTSSGKNSVTHYETLEAFRSASLLEIHLETGRTHQIRVHLSAQRHPCVGDSLYGADPTFSARLGLTRQWLHAMKLGFVHPRTHEPVQFESEYPTDLRLALEIVQSD